MDILAELVQILVKRRNGGCNVFEEFWLVDRPLIELVGAIGVCALSSRLPQDIAYV